MSRITRAEWYHRVNEAWPQIVPELTANEAVRAGRKLYYFARGRGFKGTVKVTSGNRYAWIRRGTMYVNPERGWKSLVHLLSHYFVTGPHGGAHARMELRMIKEVLRRGWLEGALKREPKPVARRDLRADRYGRLLQRIAKWEAKTKRAATALKKLYRQQRYYERVTA